MKKLLANLSLSVFSLIFLFLILEFVVFRFIFPTSDIAVPVFQNGLIRYQPYQTGVYRVKNEIEAKFRINSNGWNSQYENYTIKKPQGKKRIALIGDSYIAAFQVNYDNSVAEKLEKKLGSRNTEVYRFGIDGAPLSQYLEMLREEVVHFSPDIVIINIVHNDFDESYKFIPGVFRSSFLKYVIENNKVSKEILPTQYQKHWYSSIREKSATWKYLAYRQQIRFGLLRDLILGGNDEKLYRGNIDTSEIERNKKNNEIITDYTLRKMKEICDKNGIRLIILMDADDDRIYEIDKTGKSTNDSAYHLNKMVEKVTRLNKIEFIDLQDKFSNDYAKNKHRFSFNSDGHWNEYAHSLVAEILSNKIKNDLHLKP